MANGSTEKITVFGPSMGGLVSRYALSWMEKNNLNANCKLWVSFDSPHLGANVNLGLQYTLELMKFAKKVKDAKKTLLDAPAARQMLIQHYRGQVGEQVSGDPVFHTRFLQAMNDIGFPQAACLRKVALNNGSKNGTFQNFSPCGDVMKIGIQLRPNNAQIQFCWAAGFIGRLFGVKKVCQTPLIEVRASTAPSNYDRCLIARRYFIGLNGDNGDIYVRGNGQPSADLIPGAYQNIFSQITEKAKMEKWFYGVSPEIYFTEPTFVPSFSSYALKTANPNWGASLSSIYIQTDTPFDAIYAPDQNEEHTELTKAGVDFVRAQLALADQQCQQPNPTLPLTNGCYTVKAKHSNKFMQPENNNFAARIRQYGENGQSNQKFQLETVNGASYKISSVSSGKVWEYNDISNGSGITQGDWANGNFQRWNLGAWGDGTYKIEANHVLGQLADVEGVSSSDGAGLHLWASHGGDNQRYYFSSVSCGSSPPINGNGTGLTGNYFNNKNLSGSPVFTRLDETINYAWGGNGPGNGVGNDNFSVRWEGQIESPVSGSITFKTNNDDGTRVWINGQLLIDNWVDQGPTWKTGSISLTAGQKYNIKMEYYENGGGAQAQLFWGYQGQSEQIVPKASLFPLNGCTPPAAPTVTANPTSVSSGQPSQLTASGCSGNITWSHGLSGNPVQVNPTSTTTYTATCTVNGCSSSSSVTINVGNGNTLPACNCGFSLTSATQNSGQYTASFQFISCSVSQINWSIKSGSTVITSGSENVTAATVPFTVPTNVNTGNYTLQVDVVNCSGTGTIPFNYTKPGVNNTSFSQCLEAESSSGNGAIIGDPNASNGQTRGSENNNNHYVDYAITNVPTAGTYYAKLRYYSSSTTPVVGVQVNGGNTQNVNLNNSGSWNIVWTEQTIPVSLNSGNNTIRISGVSGGSCRQDRLCVNNNANARISFGMETEEISISESSEPTESEILQVSPNPNNGTFEVSFDLAIDQKATLSVYEISGKAIYEQKLTGNGRHHEKVVLADHASGIYVVELRKANGVKVKKTLVIK